MEVGFPKRAEPIRVEERSGAVFEVLDPEDESCIGTHEFREVDRLGVIPSDCGGDDKKEVQDK